MKAKSNGTWDMPRWGRYRKVGERVMIDGKPYRVEMVNNCRARCVPCRKFKVTIKDKVFKTQRSFMARGRCISIAPITER